MTSILTNASSMVALQTLRSINSNLNQTQAQISTGKAVASAKDNSAVWAISKVMESDVSGFSGIADSLATGQAMVGVARTATESITDLLRQVKDKVVAAQDPSADTAKLQNEADQLIGQVESIIGAAQFNGVNLIKSGAANETVLSSLDRSGNRVSASTIAVDAIDLSTTAAAATGAVAAGSTNGTSFVAGGANVISGTITDSSTASVALSGLDVGDTVTVTIDNKNYSYSVTADDVNGSNTASDLVAVKLADMINAAGVGKTFDAAGNVTNYGITGEYDSGTPGDLVFSNGKGDGSDMAVTVRVEGAGTGGLGALNGFSITGATAIADVETMINASIDAAAQFGAIESRLEIQSEFVKNLTDSLKTGIGALVDADMEEASARLQALQVQQQLGTQALSIANQGPQNLLSLFR
ncbi:flagellin [Rhodovulum visakhapatnamense]|uniref:Flagellin n=1 Tax=Rhodovulum visakhapatnamense TaxID=364297 RepID=A0A4R8FNV1_9RHOB|nr:flagellin [Rhodovulum visakhapatnamense]TDX24877.1 flagellin [Rhodovulum visakhapatnamense]